MMWICDFILFFNGHTLMTSEQKLVWSFVFFFSSFNIFIWRNVFTFRSNFCFLRFFYHTHHQSSSSYIRSMLSTKNLRQVENHAKCRTMQSNISDQPSWLEGIDRSEVLVLMSELRKLSSVSRVFEDLWASFRSTFHQVFKSYLASKATYLQLETWDVSPLYKGLLCPSDRRWFHQRSGHHHDKHPGGGQTRGPVVSA